MIRTDNVDWTERAAELAQLTAAARRLSDAVALQATQLAEEGRVPSEELVRDLAGYRLRVIQLGRSIDAGLDEPADLQELETRLSAEVRPEPEFAWDSSSDSDLTRDDLPSTLATRPMLSIPDLARRSQEAPAPERRLLTSSLICELVRIDELAFASVLARGLERDGESPLDSQLLRALLLGRALTFAQGELARALELDLQRFREANLSARGDARLARELLLRAAVLPPALFAPSATFDRVLRALQIAPELAQTHTFCLRLWAIGERLKGTPVLSTSSNGLSLGRLPPDVEVLKDALVDLSPAARIELNAVSCDTDSRPVVAAAAACRRTIEDVTALLSGQSTRPLREPSVARLLNADLLRVSEISLDAAWQPTSSAAACEAAIHRALVGPLPDWTEALKQAPPQGDDLRLVMLHEMASSVDQKANPVTLVPEPIRPARCAESDWVLDIFETDTP